MKNVLLQIAIFALIFSAGIVACKKDSNTPSKQQTSSIQNNFMRTASNLQAESIKISPYGFLVLDSNGLRVYSDFIYNNETNDILNFLDSIGIKSQVKEVGQANNALDDSIENGEFMFNNKGIVQIGDIIIRGVNQDGYLLAMPAEFLTDETYLKLSSKIFDPNVMVKLSTNGNYNPNMSEYVRANIGQDGTINPPPPPNPQYRFWGWGSWHRSGGVACYRHYYIFWISVGTDYGYCP